MNSDFVFDNILPPLLIAWMQFSSSLLTEVMNLFLLTGQTDILAVITGYIAVMVISEIDNTYLQAIRDVTLKKIMSNEEDFQPKYVQGFIHHSERECCNKFMFVCLKIVKLFYNSIYFYFFPFLVILMNYLS